MTLSVCLILETRLLYDSFGGVFLLKVEAIFRYIDELKAGGLSVMVVNHQDVTVDKRLMVRVAK